MGSTAGFSRQPAKRNVTMSVEDLQETRYSVLAFNYAHDSENKIHDDLTARRFGFSGGLVPGVADFAYMVRPVADRLGAEWLQRGAMKARFKAPVYDGEEVQAVAVPASERVAPGNAPVTCELALELHTPRGLCAEGAAWVPEVQAVPEPPEPSSFPSQPAPERGERPPASLAALPVGTVLAMVPLAPRDDDGLLEIANRYRDTSPIWQGEEAALHPAEILAMANEALVSTVKMGPWIHAASELQLYGIPPRSEALELRCKIARAYERSGHKTVEIDGALISLNDPAASDVVRARVRHTAIIEPRQVAT